jgi:hypothetical protein
MASGGCRRRSVIAVHVSAYFQCRWWCQGCGHATGALLSPGARVMQLGARQQVLSSYYWDTYGPMVSGPTTARCKTSRAGAAAAITRRKRRCAAMWSTQHGCPRGSVAVDGGGNCPSPLAVRIEGQQRPPRGLDHMMGRALFHIHTISSVVARRRPRCTAAGPSPWPWSR